MSHHWVDIMNNSRVGRYMDDVEKNLIMRYMPKQSLNVLDVGGGTGRWSRWLVEQNHRQTLMDIDRSALKVIRQFDPDLTILQADAQHIPAPRESFDMVIAVQVFGLIPDEARFLAELHRVLKPGGLLFMSWSNRRSIKGLLYYLYSTLKGTPQAERHRFYSTSHTENLALLEASHFTVLDAIGYSWALLPRSHNSILVDFFVAFEQVMRLNRWLSVSPNIMLAAKKT